MRNGIFLALFLAVAGTGSALAMDSDGVEAAAVLSKQQSIRAEASAGKGQYKDMDQATRNDLFAKQDIVFRLLEGKQHSDELTEPQRVELFNALAAIEATLNNAKSEQMVCEFVRKIGSNRPERICKTRARREKERDEARNALQSCSGASCS